MAFARAIIVPPKLLLCDEPTSALDASLAASVLNLLQDLRRELGMAVMFVTHDLAAARFISDRTAVMYLGQIVEVGADRGGDQQSRSTRTPRRCWLRCPSRASAAGPVARRTGEPARGAARMLFHPRCTERVEGATDVAELLSIDGTSQHLAACLLATNQPRATTLA